MQCNPHYGGLTLAILSNHGAKLTHLHDFILIYVKCVFIRYYFLTMDTYKQGSRKSKIGWELTKSGCHVRSPELFKKKTYNWLVETYFLSYFSWLAKSGCQNQKLAGNTFPPFPSFWSPAYKLAIFNLKLFWFCIFFLLL